MRRRTAPNTQMAPAQPPATLRASPQPISDSSPAAQSKRRSKSRKPHESIHDPPDRPSTDETKKTRKPEKNNSWDAAQFPARWSAEKARKRKTATKPARNN